MTLDDPLECDATSKFSVCIRIASSAFIGTLSRLLKFKEKIIQDWKLLLNAFNFNANNQIFDIK